MTLDEFAMSKAQEWGKENDYAVIERIKKQSISARATIIQRRYDNTKIFPQSIIMTLKCKDVIKVVDDCECFSGCGAMWRSKEKIPMPIIVKDDSYFSFVGEVKGIKSFSTLKPEEIQDIPNRKFSSREFFYFYVNNYLYFPQAVNGFTARFVPDNPLDILALGECDCGCIVDGELILEGSLEEGISGLLDKRRPLILNKETEVTIDGNDT